MRFEFIEITNNNREGVWSKNERTYISRSRVCIRAFLIISVILLFLGILGITDGSNDLLVAGSWYFCIMPGVMFPIAMLLDYYGIVRPPGARAIQALLQKADELGEGDTERSKALLRDITEVRNFSGLDLPPCMIEKIASHEETLKACA